MTLRQTCAHFVPPVSETVTTHWSCELCGRTGSVTLDRHTAVFDGFYAIEDAHREAAQDGMRVCPANTRDLRVTVDAPHGAPVGWVEPHE